MLALIGAGVAGFAIPALLVALVAKLALCRLYFPESTWGDFTPRKALQRRNERDNGTLSALACLYALSQRLGEGLFFIGLILFLAGYLSWRLGS